MSRRFFLDSVASRLALTVMLAISAAAALDLVFMDTAGVWARPSLDDARLFEQAATLTRVAPTVPIELRPRFVAAGKTEAYAVDWSPIKPVLAERRGTAKVRKIMRQLLQDPDRQVMVFQSPEVFPAARHDKVFGAAAFGMAVSLQDGTWLIFKVNERSWGFTFWKRNSILLGFILVSTAGISFLAARSLVRPIEAFAEAARGFGVNPKAPPMVERGPHEIRAAANAFNAMQTQIKRFVTDRTDMLAAISHDLRTPLTRVRLRGEFIEDLDQQRRLFRDVEEMQAMVDAALALFYDEATEEQSTSFDLSELVRLVVENLADQGKAVEFNGLDHVVYQGRPFALKRAFGNLIENACFYGRTVTAELQKSGGGIVLFVQDDGPGIPDNLLERVFSPFYRVERSRNRQTGGVGLGLTSARTIVRAHGGDIVLKNRSRGGLLVIVNLPLLTPARGRPGA